MARSTYTIKVTNSTKLKRQLKELPEELRTGIRKAVRSSAAAVRADARKRVRVDTGDLRRSIRYKTDRDGLGAVVKVHEYYGHFIEFGTSSIPAEPFLRPAAEAERKQFPSRISDDVRKALGLK
jgi:HK97 gp10 family phage protein